MRVRESRVVAHSAAQMYRLVDDIESYPLFLPWCERVEVSRRDDEDADGGEEKNQIVQATLHLRHRGLRASFATENRHRPSTAIDMKLAAGALKSLSGKWRFSPVDERRSRVDFDLQCEFRSSILGGVMRALFQRAMTRLTAAFVARADDLESAAANGAESIRVEVVYARPENQWSKRIRLPRGATIADALAQSGVLRAFPEIDLGAQTVGVYGAPRDLQAGVEDGARVEIYRPLTADPRAARRARAR